MTPELARAMKRAGCRGVEFGADTASPSILRALGKPFSQEDIRAASRACREAGLPAAYYLIFGGPGRPRRPCGDVWTLIDELRPQALLAFVGIRIYPNTPLHGIAVSDGVIAEEDDLLFPRFYVSPQIGAEALTATVGSHAKGHAELGCAGAGHPLGPRPLERLRRSGRRGPLWDLAVTHQNGGTTCDVVPESLRAVGGALWRCSFPPEALRRTCTTLGAI